MARDHGAIGFAVFDVLKASAALEQVHCCIDHPVDARDTTATPAFLDYGQRPLSGRRDIKRCGTTTFPHTLGFFPEFAVGDVRRLPRRGAHGARPPGVRAALRARDGDLCALDMLEREVRRTFRAVQRPEHHPHGQLEAQELAEEETWRSVSAWGAKRRWRMWPRLDVACYARSRPGARTPGPRRPQRADALRFPT